ncbi:hypothetical protein M5X17_29730 [Paenibacillus alvei]|uniref:Uncharacterized protein n=1 Tax=Paenibacillus alvei TaxID=44250 RepID=A0ABT4GZA2_PAEAL|nr:hypothetical protein [Paenibacillus alvei]MCY9544344.1 hypothetical protein [Paenibacillus alvei]MCY9708566.1 hypothetical protein [Paenibacillus alvei]MCY9737882.1 hypothetical protein [Paenibacillus alvei]MCY9762053.1 hypothetical protein [Paenibacillus alvei]MCY9770094.1 hypothetical protein [Paenibacillus alvei]
MSDADNRKPCLAASGHSIANSKRDMPIWAETPPTKQLAMTMPRKNGENNIPPIVWAISKAAPSGLENMVTSGNTLCIK